MTEVRANPFLGEVRTISWHEAGNALGSGAYHAICISRIEQWNGSAWVEVMTIKDASPPQFIPVNGNSAHD